MSNKIFNAQEIKTEKVGVNQSDPLSYVDISGDIFANQYQFGHNQDTVWGQSLIVDFDGDIVQSFSLGGETVFSTANRTNLDDHLKAVTVRIFAGEEDRRIDFDKAIRFLGNFPTGLPSGKMGILSLNSFGPSEEDTVAVYRTEGEFLVGIPEPSILFNKNNQITGESCFTYDVDEDELQVGGHILPCTGEYPAGTFDLGSLTQYWRSLYLDGLEITIENVNTKYYVPEDSDGPTGDHSIGITGSLTQYDEFISKEIVITTKELDLTYTGHHEITTSNQKRFYVDELGLVITSGENVTKGIDVQFGYGDSESNAYIYNSGLIESISIEAPLDSYDRERFMTPKTACGTTNLVATVTSGADADTLYGRFYYKGMFIENEY